MAFDEVVPPAEIMMDKENQGVEIVMLSTFPSHHSYKTAVGNWSQYDPART